jgi:hypothetical protein
MHVAEEVYGERGPFVSLAEELIAEQGRLAALADRCRIDGEGLAAREAAVSERERALEDRRHDLAQEAEGLSRWRDELHEKLRIVEEREARVATAQERELRLAQLGSELLAQYGTALTSDD